MDDAPGQIAAARAASPSAASSARRRASSPRAGTGGRNHNFTAYKVPASGMRGRRQQRGHRGSERHWRTGRATRVDEPMGPTPRHSRWALLFCLAQSSTASHAPPGFTRELAQNGSIVAPRPLPDCGARAARGGNIAISDARGAKRARGRHSDSRRARTSASLRARHARGIAGGWVARGRARIRCAWVMWNGARARRARGPGTGLVRVPFGGRSRRHNRPGMDSGANRI